MAPPLDSRPTGASNQPERAARRHRNKPNRSARSYHLAADLADHGDNGGVNWTSPTKAGGGGRLNVDAGRGNDASAVTRCQSNVRATADGTGGW